VKISRVETTPLRIPYKKPFYWAQGVIEAAEVVLVSVSIENGLTGYGESMSSGSTISVQSLLQQAGHMCIGRSPFEITQLG
jgi:L-alanine-DL-glutamate epimerase-like enolase superfamily enzyme